MTYRRVEHKELVSLAARTSDGASSWAEIGEYATARVYVDVTTVSGTSPTLDIAVQDSPDGDKAYSAKLFATITTPGQYAISLGEGEFGRYLRLKWTIGGTSPSFTFKVEILLRT